MQISNYSVCEQKSPSNSMGGSSKQALEIDASILRIAAQNMAERHRANEFKNHGDEVYHQGTVKPMSGKHFQGGEVSPLYDAALTFLTGLPEGIRQLVIECEFLKNKITQTAIKQMNAAVENEDDVLQMVEDIEYLEIKNNELSERLAEEKWSLEEIPGGGQPGFAWVKKRASEIKEKRREALHQKYQNSMIKGFYFIFYGKASLDQSQLQEIYNRYLSDEAIVVIASPNKKAAPYMQINSMTPIIKILEENPDIILINLSAFNDHIHDIESLVSYLKTTDRPIKISIRETISEESKTQLQALADYRAERNIPFCLEYMKPKPPQARQTIPAQSIANMQKEREDKWLSYTRAIKEIPAHVVEIVDAIATINLGEGIISSPADTQDWKISYLQEKLEEFRQLSDPERLRLKETLDGSVSRHYRK